MFFKEQMLFYVGCTFFFNRIRRHQHHHSLTHPQVQARAHQREMATQGAHQGSCDTETKYGKSIWRCSYLRGI